VREQAGKLRKQMRCSDLQRKPVEISRNDLSPIRGINKKWQAGGKARFIYLPPGYNNDPCIERSVQVKPLLIDLEAYDESYGDKAEGASHRERLSEEALTRDATVRPTQRKVWKLAEMTNSLIRGVTTWLRHTAGCSFYQGQCISNDLWLQNLRSTGI
jgi:hypothetical protein